jgi:hypothetical protein
MISLIFSDSTTWYMFMAPRLSRLFIGKNSVCRVLSFLGRWPSHDIRVARLFYKRCQAISAVIAELSYVSNLIPHVPFTFFQGLPSANIVKSTVVKCTASSFSMSRVWRMRFPQSTFPFREAKIPIVYMPWSGPMSAVRYKPFSTGDDRVQ